MLTVGRRAILRGLAAATTAAVASGFIPEAAVLHANGATMSVDTGKERRLRGRVMSSGEVGRAIGRSRSRPDGAALWSYAARAGLSARHEQAMAIEASWDDAQPIGSITMVPLSAASASHRGMYFYRATPESELVGLGVWQADGWIVVYTAANSNVAEQARFKQLADKTIVLRTPDGTERVLPAPDTAASAGSGRSGLAAPLADDPYVQTCTTICNWVVTVVCSTLVFITAFFVCAAVTVGTLSAGALFCGFVFLAIDVVVCNTVPQWSCGQLCA